MPPEAPFSVVIFSMAENSHFIQMKRKQFGVSAPQTALLQIPYSLIPDGTGIRQPSASRTHTARLSAPSHAGATTKWSFTVAPLDAARIHGSNL